jgi:hypothetical protein
MRWQSALAAMVVVLLSACSWVSVSSSGEKVRVLSADEVSGCKHLGKTTVSTAGKIGALERYPEKIQEELNTLARNSAPELGGDTVVAVDKPVDGRQVFEVYRCVPAAKGE